MAGTTIVSVVLGNASSLHFTAIVAALVVLISVLYYAGVFRSKESAKDKNRKGKSRSYETQKGEGGKKEVKKNVNKQQFNPIERKNRQQPVFVHPWSVGSLKGHTSPVLDLDLSGNGKYMASCAEDRTILVWLTKSFGEKTKKSVRTNIQFDHAKKVKWSPDSKAFIAALANDNTVQVFKLGKKPDGSLGSGQPALTFPSKHKSDINEIAIATSGKFILTSSVDTNIKLWNLKGAVLASIDNHQIKTNYATISPCGRFIGSSGFTSDVKVWEVKLGKNGEFKEVVRAYELKGHTAAVYNFSFNCDSSKVATVSKDGTWRLWATNVEYALGQDPYVLLNITFPHLGSSIVALSPDARTVAVASASIIYVYSGLTGKQDGQIENAHDDITSLVFDQANKFLISSGDKVIRVFHNVVGYRETIKELEEKRRTATGSTKDRIFQQINEAKAALKSILKPQ